jgi:pimeloyl-ACP methyl ester carboxylesterase
VDARRFRRLAADLSPLMELTHNDVMTAATLSLDVYHLPLDWLVHEEDGTVWVAIEGSDESVDWRRNLEMLYTSSDTHAGFANYATLLMAQMLSAGVNLDFRKRLILCGHSLGGAVATIIASHLQDRFPYLGLVTFGSPRPGGRKFRDRLQVPHLRYVHGDDIVPHLPSSLLGFRHTIYPQILPIAGDTPLRGIADHDMDFYLNALLEA